MHRTGHPAVRPPRCDCQPGTVRNARKEAPMAKKKTPRLPKLGRHSSGQGRVCLSGRMHYLGAFGTIECQRNYTELVDKWIANGRRPLDPPATCVQVRRLRDLFADYLGWLDETGRYRKD